MIDHTGLADQKTEIAGAKLKMKLSSLESPLNSAEKTKSRRF